MTDILLVSNMMPHIQEALEAKHTLHRLYEADDRQAFLASVADSIEGVATMGKADAGLKLTPDDLAEIARCLPPGFAYGDRYTEAQWPGAERYC